MRGLKISLVVLTACTLLFSAASMTMAIVNAVKQPTRTVRRFAPPQPL